MVVTPGGSLSQSAGFDMSALVADRLFDVRTHNGFVSMVSKRTGEHRTFRVWTQSDDSSFMPGRRLVGLLSGPDNESDYIAFGVLSESGDCIHLWKKHKESAFFRWVAAALLDPVRYSDRVDFSFDGRCRRCNRLLTCPESVESGIGPICSEREALGGSV